MGLEGVSGWGWRGLVGGAREVGGRGSGHVSDVLLLFAYLFTTSCTYDIVLSLSYICHFHLSLITTFCCLCHYYLPDITTICHMSLPSVTCHYCLSHSVTLHMPSPTLPRQTAL